MQKEQRGRYLLKNTIIFALGNFGTKFIAFFMVPLYTNILTTSEYGTVDLIYTIGIVLVPCVTLNIAESVMRFSLDKNSNYEKIMSTGLGLMWIAIIASALLTPIFSFVEYLQDYVIYIFLYTITFAISQLFLCYLKGKELLLHYSMASIIQTVCIAVFNILFLSVFHKGVRGYLMAYILANVVTALYAFLTGNVIQVLKNFRIDFSLSKKMIQYSVVLIPNSFMWWIMNSADRIMVIAIAGIAENGVYAVAYKIPTLLSTVTGVFNQAWSFSAIRENESIDKEEYSNDIFDRLVSVVIIVAIGLLMVVKVFLKYYVGKDYFDSWRYIPYLMLGFVFMALGSFVGTSYTVHKDSWGFLISGTIGAVVNVILNFVMIPGLGATGAAVATCISYIAVFVYRVLDTRKYLKLKVFKKKHVAGYILLVLAAMTLFVDNVYGQIMLIIEFVLSLIVFKKLIITFGKEIYNCINKKKKNKLDF